MIVDTVMADEETDKGMNYMLNSLLRKEEREANDEGVQTQILRSISCKAKEKNKREGKGRGKEESTRHDTTMAKILHSGTGTGTKQSM